MKFAWLVLKPALQYLAVLAASLFVLKLVIRL